MVADGTPALSIAYEYPGGLTQLLMLKLLSPGVVIGAGQGTLVGGLALEKMPPTQKEPCTAQHSTAHWVSDPPVCLYGSKVCLMLL